MKVLVTGSPGWLGTSLVQELIKKKWKVRCLVLPNSDIKELEKLNVEIVFGDITKKETLSEAVRGVDIVFHCAGLIHPKKIRDLYKINYLGTKNLIDAAIDAKVKRFIYVSSNSPMGTNPNRDILMREEDPYNPYKNYGKSKMMAENYVNSMFKEGKIATTIIRPCWFYGPNQPARQTRFFKMIKKGNPIIFGDGKNLRSMTYIGNLTYALILAATKKEAIGQTYWIADKRPYSTIEIYQTIADILGVQLKPRFVPKVVSTMFELLDDILQSLNFYQQEVHVAGEMDKDIACSIEKSRRELGYEPKVDLREGMKKSIEWCEQQGIKI